MILNKRTLLQLTALGQQQPHAILLVGPQGSGKKHTARWLAQHYLNVEKAKVQMLSSEKDASFTIEMTRELQTLYKLKSLQNEKRAVIIDDASRMSTEAQNSLLKLIEEPPQGVHFILTTGDVSSILPTIVSRCTTITIVRPADSDISEYIDATFGAIKDRRTLIAAADGKIGELHKLILDKKYCSQRFQELKSARKFIESDSFEKMSLASEFISSKQRALNALHDILLILQMASDSKRLSQQNAKRMNQNSNITINVHNAIQGNGNIKLQVDHLIASWR